VAAVGNGVAIGADYYDVAASDWWKVLVYAGTSVVADVVVFCGIVALDSRRANAKPDRGHESALEVFVQHFVPSRRGIWRGALLVVLSVLWSYY